MFHPTQIKPNNLLLRFRQLLDGYNSIFRICILIVGLPFLLTQGISTLDFTVTSITPENSELVENPIHLSLHGQPIDDEQDVCHPVPSDTDPSDKTSGMVLHLDVHLRKDFRLLWHPVGYSFRIVELVDIPSFPCTNEQYTASRPSLLPYFPQYPVFLIGDLPPPLS